MDEWIALAFLATEIDVSANTGLGAYTAFASLGVVGVIGLLCLYMVMHTIPSERKAERETLEKINSGHDGALDSLGKTLHDAVRESSVMFATTLREYREEQARRDDAERASRDGMLRSSDEKVDRLASSFQDLAMVLGDVMQSLAIPNRSGALKRRRQETLKENNATVAAS